jgi:hypothetical protein
MKKSGLSKPDRKELESKIAEAITNTLAAYDEASAPSIGKHVKRGTKDIVKKFLKAVKKNNKKSKKSKKNSAPAVADTIRPNGIPINTENISKLEKEYNS